MHQSFSGAPPSTSSEHQGPSNAPLRELAANAALRINRDMQDTDAEGGEGNGNEREPKRQRTAGGAMSVNDLVS